MKIARREELYTNHSRFNEPTLSVVPGEEFRVETELCSGDWLQSVSDRYDPEKSQGPNPAVCVRVEGAEPGDILALSILDIRVDRLGYTGFPGDRFELPGKIYKREWPLTTRTVEIRGGQIEWNNSLKIPVQPMIGTIGTAPAQETPDNSRGGRHGGNMDVNEVTIGATIYLPVAVSGALLHIGDAHAIQGDGEINRAGGIECRAEARLKTQVLPGPRRMNWIRLENEEYIMTVACCETVEESFQEAAGELLRWLVDGYGYEVEEAYLLMGLVMEARCTQFVNPTRTYICKLPKKFIY